MEFIFTTFAIFPPRPDEFHNFEGFTADCKSCVISFDCGIYYGYHWLCDCGRDSVLRNLPRTHWFQQEKLGIMW